MAVMEYNKRQIAVDDDGYLINFDDWDEDVARALAGRVGIEELTPEDIAVLIFIRNHYRVYNFFPIVHSICAKLHEPKDCVSEKFFNPLMAWKIGGLPHPEEPILSLLEAGQSPG